MFPILRQRTGFSLLVRLIQKEIFLPILTSFRCLTDPALTVSLQSPSEAFYIFKPQGIIGGAVQAFFSWRVKVLTRNTFLSLFILFCSVISFCESFPLGF